MMIKVGSKAKAGGAASAERGRAARTCQSVAWSSACAIRSRFDCAVHLNLRVRTRACLTPSHRQLSHCDFRVH
eukprot:3756492-Rhodomonas_salina.3